MTKKLLLAGAAFLIGSSVSAQIFSEDFEGGAIPTGWGISTNATDGGWNVGTESSLGSTYFAFTGNSTQFIGTNDDDCNCDKSDDFLYSTAVDLTGQTGSVFMTYNQYFFNASYDGAQEVGAVEVSTNGGTTYSVISAMAGFGGWVDVTIDLSAYAGQSIMVGFRYNDGGGWTYGMGIDDISVFVPDANDYTLADIDIPNYHSLSGGSVDVNGYVMNNGADPITSMDVEYTVNGGTPVTANLTGLNIMPLTGSDFTHPTSWTPSAEGIYAIELEITAVNGASDADVSDNAMAQDVDVYSTSYPRTVLYETFTSSTCAPCVAGNANFENVIAGIPVDEVASIKYQMSWPGDGDPYNNADGNTRRTVYQISSVPGMEIDGGWDGNSNSFVASLHTDAVEVPAFVKIDAYYYVNVESKTVSTCATIESLKDLGNATLHMAIKEFETTANVGTNGETEFLNVVKKMAPTANGESIAITAGMTQTICTDYTFNGDYRLPNNSADLIDDATEHSVEEFDDLGVVVWLQDASNVVLNSTNAMDSPVSVNDNLQNTEMLVYPNPASNVAVLSLNSALANEAAIQILNVVGKTVLDLSTVSVSQGVNKIELHTETLNSGVYFVQVTIDGLVSTSQLVIQK